MRNIAKYDYTDKTTNIHTPVPTYFHHKQKPGNHLFWFFCGLLAWEVGQFFSVVLHLSLFFSPIPPSHPIRAFDTPTLQSLPHVKTSKKKNDSELFLHAEHVFVARGRERSERERQRQRERENLMLERRGHFPPASHPPASQQHIEY